MTKKTVDQLSKEMRAAQRAIKDLANTIEKDRQETKRELQAWARENKKRIDYLDRLFGDQWGKLMESLVKGDLIPLLKQKGIEVEGTAKETEKNFNGKQYEYDIIATNGKEVVVVEVKTTLNLRDVDKFVKKLEVFKKVFPEYKNKRVYGAMAYLKANRGADRNAMKKGLFVIRATGSSASITNPKNFRPAVF